MLKSLISDWWQLPFAEIWCVDYEFYPGPGLANGGHRGDQITPLCGVGIEMRTGRVIRRWQDEFGPFPFHRLDHDALMIGYYISAEFSAHLALGWGQPARAIDAYVEFRHFVNDGAAKAEDREKGFYGLAGALRYFCEDGLDVTHKKDMRERILQGPPFTEAERAQILEYCEDDVRALTRLVPHLIPTIRSLPHAYFRAQYAWAAAHEERRGVPFDLPMLARIRDCWAGIKGDLMTALDPWGVHELGADGKPHFSAARFETMLQHNKMGWPRREDGALDLRDQTFRDMVGRYPQLEPLRELRCSLSKLKLESLEVGRDGRNRALLGIYGSKTARNQPSNAKFVFGPAKWIRFLISPPPGRVLIHRDFCQQEVRIAAVLSGDAALLQACEVGDVYLGIAGQLGFLSEVMSVQERRDVRNLFKTVVLGIQYGLGARSLMIRTGLSMYEACEILARLRAQFRVFEDWIAGVLDWAGLDLEISTPFGWVLQCPPGINPRTVRNFPMQSTGAEILHIASILAERRGVRIVAPVHDALLAEADLDQAEEASVALDRVMRDASAIVLRGYELPTDMKIIHPGERYEDDRGRDMWGTVTRLVAKLEEKRA